MPEVNENADGQTLDVSLGGTLTVRLVENPTTGYRWRVVADGAPACRPAGDEYQAPTGPPGGPGQHFWSFVAVEPGDGRIELASRRSWEREPARTLTFFVRVVKR